MSCISRAPQDWAAKERADASVERADPAGDVGPVAPPPEIPLIRERSLDALHHYLNEIGRVPLLTSAEEIDLAMRIERGRTAEQRLQSSEPLRPAARAALEADVAAGQSAFCHLIQANLRLVVSIARRYAGHGLAMLDMIQEGNLGLIHAAVKFEYRRGCRFSTYATWWIRQSITRAIAEQGRTIRLPVHLSETAGQIRRATEMLAQTLDRQPRPDDIAAVLGMPVERVIRTVESARLPISLETPLGADGDDTLGDILPSDALPPPVETVAHSCLRRDLIAALDHLTVRQRQVIQLRYGLSDGHAHTLVEIGELLGMTRERARQIESNALRRLRNLDGGLHLRDYLE